MKCNLKADKERAGRAQCIPNMGNHEGPEATGGYIYIYIYIYIHIYMTVLYAANTAICRNKDTHPPSSSLLQLQFVG